MWEQGLSVHSRKRIPVNDPVNDPARERLTSNPGGTVKPKDLVKALNERRGRTRGSKHRPLAQVLDERADANREKRDALAAKAEAQLEAKAAKRAEKSLLAADRAARKGPRSTAAKSEKKWLDGCDLPDCDLPDCDCGGFITGLLLVPALAALVMSPLATPHQRMTRMVEAYRTKVSPRTPPRCNLTPTCSTFGRDVLLAHGALRSARLIRARLRQCRLAGARARRGA